MPVRKEIENIKKKKYTSQNIKLINILITGGSLGAEVMATNVARALCNLPKNLKNKISILQQVRKENYSYVEKLYDKASINHKLETYIENMSESLNWCDFIICRSGASTIAENLISGRPSIMIPLEISADNHQMKNALLVEKIGAGQIISNQDLSDLTKLVERFKSIILNPKALQNMSKMAKKNAVFGSSDKLISLGENILSGNR